MNVLYLGTGLSAESLETVLQEKYPHEIARRRGREQLRNGAGLRFKCRRVLCPVACPQIDDRVGSGIVLAPGFRSDLRDEGRFQERTDHGPAQHALPE